MPDRRSPSPPRAGRGGPVSDRLALLLPGLYYPPERPLLHFARAVFVKHGWAVREVRWPEPPAQRDGDDLLTSSARLRSFVQAHTSRILEHETASEIALVGKSMGAFAAAVAADRSLPGVWLTPVLRDSPLPADLRRTAAPFLLAGSAADPSWDPEIARSFGQPWYEAHDADHGMETIDDPVNSADVLRHVTIAMDSFVSTL